MIKKPILLLFVSSTTAVRNYTARKIF